MSEEEHQFESNADAGPSNTFPQQAGTIRKNGYIVIKNRACKVLQSTIYDVDLDRILQSIHVYLQELGMEEIRRSFEKVGHGSHGDAPSKYTFCRAGTKF